MKIKKSRLLLVAALVVLALVFFSTPGDEQTSSAVSTVSDLMEIFSDSTDI